MQFLKELHHQTQVMIPSKEEIFDDDNHNRHNVHVTSDVDTAYLCRTYLDSVALQQQTTATTVELAYVLTYCNVSESNSSSSSQVRLPPLYGVQVSFTSSPFYAPIPTLQLPILIPTSTSAASSSSSSSPSPSHFPHSYQLTIKLTPHYPLPTSFDVHVAYTQHNGLCEEGNIGSLRVSFQDLFLPVTLPPSFSQFVSRVAPSLL
jgi:hypothetical protein